MARSKTAANNKIKRNNFFEGFVPCLRDAVRQGLAKCVQETNILQVQKMRTTLRCKLSFCLPACHRASQCMAGRFAFFAERASHLIPQKNYFVNPFFEKRNYRNTKPSLILPYRGQKAKVLVDLFRIFNC